MKNLLKTLLFLCSTLNAFSLTAQVCFNPVTTYNVTDINANSMCSGFYNNDSKIDFAVTTPGGVVVMLQDSNGDYNSTQNIPSVTLTSSICSADFNQDGNQDLATYSYGPGMISFLWGDGNGNFNLDSNAIIPTGYYNVNNAICAVDLNHDGKMDLAMSTGFNKIGILLGTGNGTFASFSTLSTSTTINSMLIAADFNQDGKMDLATKRVVILGDGIGGFTDFINYGSANSPVSVITADFNNDGKLDLVTANNGSGANAGFTGDIAIFLGDGAGGFGSSINFSIGDSIVPPNSGGASLLLCHADIDGDNKEDIALGTFKSGGDNSSNVTVLLGDGNGGFSSPTHIPVPNYTHALIATEINSGSKKDIALLTRGISDSSKLTILLNCSTTATENILQQNDIQIFPNPSIGELNVTSLRSIDEISILNVLGQEIQFRQIGLNEYNLINPSPGVYFVRIKSDGVVIMKKIIVE